MKMIVEIGGCFVTHQLTDTRMGDVVEHESEVTSALKAAGGVVAVAIFANIGHQTAFVDFLGFICYLIHESSWFRRLSTQLFTFL